MQNYRQSPLLRRQIIRFVAIVGMAMILVALVMWGNDQREPSYRAADLRATAVALDIRATEIAAASAYVTPVVAVVDPFATTPVPLRSDVGSRSVPVALGEPFLTADGLVVRVLAVDGDAWPRIQEANQFNEAPTAGNRMILVAVEVTNVSSSYRDTPRRISSSDFRLVGSRGVVYTPFETETRCGVVPDELDWELFTEAKVTGNVCVQAPADESGFLLTYLPIGSWNEEPIFFALEGVVKR